MEKRQDKIGFRPSRQLRRKVYPFLLTRHIQYFSYKKHEFPFAIYIPLPITNHVNFNKI